MKSIIKAFLKASRFVFLLLSIMLIFFLCSYGIFFMSETYGFIGFMISLTFWLLFFGTCLAWEPDKNVSLKKDNKNESK